MSHGPLTPKIILTAAQTTGDSFAMYSGEYKIVLNGLGESATTAARLQIRGPGNRWVNSEQTWEGNGINAMTLSGELSYRMNIDQAGATAAIYLIRIFR